MRILFLLSFISLSAGIQAQQPGAADSIYFYEQGRKELDFVQSSGTQLLSSPLSRAGKGGLNIDITTGHFRHSQEAEQRTAAQLQTEGFSATGRFKTAGYFKFTRIWEDSLAWTQKASKSYEQPYYLASAKAGPYLRQTYDMGGIVSYNLLKEKLYINGFIDYAYERSSRSIDPRLGLTRFSFIAKPELSYKWGKSIAGIGARLGYGNETQAVAYQNDNYKNGSDTYPERVNYLVQGFGNIRSASFYLGKKNRYSGVSLHYATRFSGFTLRASGTYNVDKEDNTIPIAGSSRDSLIATYQLESSRFHLQLQKHSGRYRRQLLITAGAQNGRDFNVRAAASTYTYKHTYANLQYLVFIHNHRKWNPELGMTLFYENTYKKDGISSHQQQYNSIQPGVKASIYATTGNNDRLSFTLAPSVRIPVTSELIVPNTQVSYFTRGVVYPDYQYQVSKIAEASFTVQYISYKLFKTTPAGITAQIKYNKPLNIPEPVYQASMLPANNRMNFNLGFNLYF
ncbi:DUF6850 family outer membrane beta-barrel protein [Filimonas effusa]|uniref:DUF6850 domain-containing protein n=1 Tax=Filimonas effusa TaxID=2508721 RepID=A0A4Q1D8K0_9BACT|nr:DUF6850 family outer membrane beta-barrel protein [Filimonas effusa]RXK85652.1 hypothetical protein ESB13_02230 [Filimonas effusa]